MEFSLNIIAVKHIRGNCLDNNQNDFQMKTTASGETCHVI